MQPTSLLYDYLSGRLTPAIWHIMHLLLCIHEDWFSLMLNDSLNVHDFYHLHYMQSLVDYLIDILFFHVRTIHSNMSKNCIKAKLCCCCCCCWHDELAARYYAKKDNKIWRLENTLCRCCIHSKSELALWTWTVLMNLYCNVILVTLIDRQVIVFD